MDEKEESRRSSLSEQLLRRESSDLVRRESSDLVRRESWQSECSWGDEGSTCLGLAIDGPWRSVNPAFDSQSEISTEVDGISLGSNGSCSSSTSSWQTGSRSWEEQVAPPSPVAGGQKSLSRMPDHPHLQ